MFKNQSVKVSVTNGDTVEKMDVRFFKVDLGKLRGRRGGKGEMSLRRRGGDEEFDGFGKSQR